MRRSMATGRGTPTLPSSHRLTAERETIALVQAQDLPDVDPATPIAHSLPIGMTFDLTAEQYARDWALPQFYFHLVTAYAILRANGVPLGKADFVAHMFQYLRPGTMPGH